MSDPNTNKHPLQGLNIVVMGTLVVGTRSEVETFIADSGGFARAAVSGKTDLLVFGEKAGSKLTKAQGLGIETISEQDFYDRYIFADAKPSLEGLSVVVTGTLLIGTRADIETFIVDSGGLAKTAVSAKTDLLVFGAKAGSKLAKAQGLGIETISEQGFYARYGLN